MKWGICLPYLKLLRRRLRAFTLIELMIVLVIIGILATIAIPQYFSFRSKTMQSEVKANFAAVHRAQVAYYSENNSYTDDLKDLAWRPVGNPRYLYGFTSDAFPAPSGRNDTAELAAASVNPEYSTINMVSAPGIPLTDGDLPAGSSVDGGAFRFGAVANLDSDPELDLWEVSQTNVFSLVLNDAD